MSRDSTWFRGRARWLATGLAAAVLAGCAVYYGHRLDQAYGPVDPSRYDRPSPAQSEFDYWRDIKPIMDNRCVVCHGCYDSPCQVNLASREGLTRGSSKTRVYDAARLIAASPTRLFVDADSAAAWRGKGFYPVLNERRATPEADRDGSVLYRALRLRRMNALPEGPVLPASHFDFSLDRSQQCPAVEEMDAFEQRFPQWGMPFGLPPLSDKEYGTLTRWIEAGAPYREREPLPAAYAQRIAAWERFLNGDSLKERLMSRYVYEHWFLASLYFDDVPGAEFFRLVRSKTPPGRPIQPVATPRPYDDPGNGRVYYRLQRETETPLAKTLMPYALGARRMARLRAWFLDAPYEVTALPSYRPEDASNPFATFEQLPVDSRYRFMLEEAQFTIMGFIKGPVCRGQIALNVINDHFWVVFERPDPQQAEHYAAFLSREVANLRLPAEHESTTGLLRWLGYSGLEKNYLRAKSEYFNERFGDNPPTLQVLWDGDGVNPNAALTVFRHFDSASVVQGLIGERPQTAWIIGYPLLERIHYLLVAGFDVYGNAGHQLATRLYMDFLRMEGEMNFIGLLPRDARQGVRDRWYRGASKEHDRFLRDTHAYYSGRTGLKYATDDPLTELYGMLKAYVAGVRPTRYDLAASGLTGVPLQALAALSGTRGRQVSHLPQTTFLTVRDAAGQLRHFTLLHNNAHTNVAELLGEERRRLPDEDTLLVVNGFIGYYPNAFLLVEEDRLPALVAAVRDLASEDDYRRLLDSYGVRRTDPRFWAHSDALHAAFRQAAPREAGLFDYNRLENR